MNKKSGSIVIVIDDELIGSRSKDLDRKIVSVRKRAVEGQAVEVVADSSYNKILAVRLRARGESKQHNIEKLLGLMPDLTLNGQRVENHFDHG